MASTLRAYQRRYEEWVLQEKLAAKELEQIDKQIVASDIRREVAYLELTTHDLQVADAKYVDAHMRDKFTNRELYDWMVGQISGIYFQSYQVAYDVAKRVERSYRHELGLGDSDFIQFGYWASLKKGLLAGERLYHDLKRMEVAYLDQNKREYEITKHISLAQLDPVALVQFRETGQCFVNVPEALFDLGYTGHYMRRIKSVSMTIPSVTGPYTGGNCTLTLLKSSVRQSNTLVGGKYARDSQNDDPRFTDSIGAIQSIVTSSAQNDSGLFEPNLRDERYLPFEGAGVASQWRIELPKDFRQFDYDTISDVVLHVRYTAREVGGQLKQGAISELQTAINEITAAENEKGLARLLSLGHEFPTEYRRFLQGAAGEQSLTLQLAKDRFPYHFQSKAIQVKRVELLVKLSNALATADGSGTTFKLTCPDGSTVIDFDLSAASKLGDLLHVAIKLPKDQDVHSKLTESIWTLEVKSAAGALAKPAGRLNPAALEDIAMIIHYTVV